MENAKTAREVRQERLNQIISDIHFEHGFDGLSQMLDESLTQNIVLADGFEYRKRKNEG